MIEKVKRISAAFVVAGGMGVNMKAEPADAASGCQVGEASYYADAFHGRKTANGERFNMHAMTAASTHFSNKRNIRVRVTNLDNGESAVVRINDYGPAKKTGRVIDVSLEAAKNLDMIQSGTAPVRVCPL